MRLLPQMMEGRFLVEVTSSASGGHLLRQVLVESCLLFCCLVNLVAFIVSSFFNRVCSSSDELLQDPLLFIDKPLFLCLLHSPEH